MPNCNGKDILSALIQEPKIGIWNAVIDVDSEEAITGKVTIDIDGVTWVGTVVRGDVNAGRFHAQIVGGAGKLAKKLDAKHYRQAVFLSVLDDLMIGTGEKLSSTTDTAVRRHSVARWARPNAKAGLAVRQIADELGVSWRVLRDGTVWLGAETWPESKPTYDEIDRVPGRDSLTIAPTSPLLAPGVTFLARHVSRVTTRLEEGAGLRQDVLFEVDGSDGSRVTEDMHAVLDARFDNRIDYSRLYPSRVVAQAADGSLDLIPDAVKVRGTGLQHVPIRHGLPGITVKVPVGGKVLLFFESGDPKLPAAALWPDGSSVSRIEITADTLVVRGNIECTGEITAKSQSAPVTLSQHKHGDAMGGTLIPTPST